MEAYTKILAKILEKEGLRTVFTNFKIGPIEIAELERHKASHGIKIIIDDAGLEDSGCVVKIEKIVRLFKDLGVDGETDMILNR